jgi:hypothetical protein
MWHVWRIRNAYRVLIGKHEGKTLLGRSRLRWGYNIIMDLAEGFESMVWICLAQDREK